MDISVHFISKTETNSSYYLSWSTKPQLLEDLTSCRERFKRTANRSEILIMGDSRARQMFYGLQAVLSNNFSIFDPGSHEEIFVNDYSLDFEWAAFTQQFEGNVQQKIIIPAPKFVVVGSMLLHSLSSPGVNDISMEQARYSVQKLKKLQFSILYFGYLNG